MIVQFVCDMGAFNVLLVITVLLLLLLLLQQVIISYFDFIPFHFFRYKINLRYYFILYVSTRKEM